MIWFVENLSVRAWIGTLLPNLMHPGLASPDRIFWIDRTRPGAIASAFCSAMTGVSVERLDFKLVDIRDKDGLLLRLRLAFRDMFEVRDSMVRQPAFVAALERAEGRGRLGSFITKGPVKVTLEGRSLWRALYVLHVADWKRRQMRAVQSDGVVVLEDRPWMESLEATAAHLRIRIARSAPVLRQNDWIELLFGPKRIAQLVWCRERIRHLRLGTRGSREQSEPKVAVQFTGQLNLDEPACYSDLFFWQESGLSAASILLFTGLPQSPLDEPRTRELERHGIEAVALYSRATSTAKVPLFVHTPGRFDASIRIGADGTAAQALWLQRQVEAYDVLCDYWKAFCRRNRVGVFLSWYRFDERHLAIADGVEGAGGITAVYQRALQFDPSPGIAVETDVMFGYSPCAADVESRAGSSIPYHVSVGYFGDHRAPLVKESALGVRRSLAAHGAEFMLAYFDENSAEDSRWHTGHDFMSANYEFLLEKVLSEPWFGLAIKPKVPSTLSRRLGPVNGLLEEAIATGRCHLYEDGSLHGSQPPVAAALAADVALHGHLAAGTAGLEAALAGVPTLLLDREGWPVSPLYQLGVNKVVFQDLTTLWDAMGEYRSRPGHVPGFGDWSPMLDELDPFRDGRAAERMGTYVQWLVEGLAAGENRESVLTQTAERYQEQWGRDKIRPVEPGSWAATVDTPFLNQHLQRVADPVGRN